MFSRFFYGKNIFNEFDNQIELGLREKKNLEKKIK